MKPTLTAIEKRLGAMETATQHARQMTPEAKRNAVFSILLNESLSDSQAAKQLEAIGATPDLARIKRMREIFALARARRDAAQATFS